MYKFLAPLGFLVACLLAPTPPAMAKETEFSFYSGWQDGASGRLHSSINGDSEVSWEGKSLDMPPYWGARITWWLDNGTGFGIEANHAKVYAENRAALGYDRLEFTDGLNLLTANVWRRTRPLGRMQPYVGLGLGVAVPHVDIQPAGLAHTFGYQVTGPAAQWVLGAAMPLNDGWALFGEYKGSFSRNHVRLDSGGTIDTDVVTHALNFGVSKRF